MSDKIFVEDISKFLNCEYIGMNLIVDNVSAISNIKNKSISFVNKKNYKFNQSTEALIIAIEGYEIEENSKCSFIFSSNPRLDFVKIVNRFFNNTKVSNISDTVKIAIGCKIADDVTIGEYTVIKDNVTIGSGTIINNHVVIESNTIIGTNCYIKSGAIIGEDGFGFERDENGIPLRFPHIGNVIIGNNVEIGANCTISKGALESTIIKNNVKINDQVHIAHNVIIDEKTLIAGCVNISGSVFIGKECWISSNSTIKDGVSIGNGAFIGIASVITKDIQDNEKTASLSNLSYKDLVKYKKLIK